VRLPIVMRVPYREDFMNVVIHRYLT